jgi:hypothetical protein
MPSFAAVHRLLRFASTAACASLLAACGGGEASIGGTVSGLPGGSSVTLQNNGTDALTVSANQSFSFPTDIAAGASYEVTVLTQPVGATCTVANGSGKVKPTGIDITNVAVTCAVNASIGGTLSGLAAGNSVSLKANAQVLSLAANGSFSFPGILAAGTAYEVSVSQQPAQQTCSVANPTGTVVAGAMASVTVSCR